MPVNAETQDALPVIDVQYRTVDAFLVAYASRLSKGELFLETPTPWPLATSLRLRLNVPETPALELLGTVAWSRPGALGPGQPPGMGITLTTSVDTHGDRIDELAGRYSRPRILVVAGDPAGRAIILRYLQSLMSCEIVDTDSNDLETQGAHTLEVAVIDFDSPGRNVEALLGILKGKSSGRPDIPVLALAQLERDRTRAAQLGVDDVLPNPPSFEELQAAVMFAISRPTSWTSS